MKLNSIKYSEYQGHPKEWTLDEVRLGEKNLIVGRNSTGKTRTLNVIGSLARTLSGAQMLIPQSGAYRCEWEDVSGVKYVYEYSVKESRVRSEILTIDDKVYMERGEGGYGNIYFESIGDGVFVPFQTPENEFALVKRRDATQHSFIEPLYQWAAAVRHYNFGSSFGKEHLAVFTQSGPGVDERDANQVVGVFRNGKRDFGPDFPKKITEDMQYLGYSIDAVDIGFPTTVPPDGLPIELQSLKVVEHGVVVEVDQLAMSQGMYRVLALLTHINYLQFKKTSTCILVDDIGEGVDFERSCKLIDLLRRKADESDIQVIMSTNDKFVMNSVPLKEWTVLSRTGNHVHVSNYENSKDKFDEFRFTGLSNFSFFEMDYLNESRTE